MERLTIAIDFDGTIVKEKYPGFGDPIPGAKEAINSLYEMGHEIIINSCRAGIHQENMINYLQQAGIFYHHVNENPAWRIELYKLDCRKIGADVYIDDRNIFCREINWNEIYLEILNKCREVQHD